MNKQLEGKLPEELLQSKDINLLRSIREWADTQVQSLKKEKEQKELDKYRPDIEGKFIKKIHRSWNGPVTVPNPNNFEIAYIKKIDFVGHGFVRCKAVVISIEYSGIEQQLDKGGLTAKSFDGVQVSSWIDNQYDISFEYIKSPVILAQQEAKKEIDDVISCANLQKTVFWSNINQENKDERSEVE